ncbi:hypothetical protein PPACK8108_LOCUS2623 [Phakopsora pachyrhizi]|uniref:Uncharacterized protein n=1 Tax=Phakopsora pachyrhizi TaxID=170000 RepID=A0AAV0AIB3_PHAPC|nr:hypothetical protein PPACK8108_LOCUS2623 [Phakopsora pachyrhizi]
MKLFTSSVNLSIILCPAALAVLSGFDSNNLPYKSDASGGQKGYNRCGTRAKPDSMCQNAFIKSVEDFCFFAPPEVMNVGDAERISVSYCSKDGYGARLFPKGTFKNLQYVRTPHYVQLTGVGDFTKVNVRSGDAGGELDPSGADGHGNPIGGLVFGEDGQFDHWTEFISDNEFCIRACYNGPQAKRYCEHIYDVMGCKWNMPGNYEGPGFEQCDGDSVTHPMGEYETADGSIYKWKQGELPIPPAGPQAKVYNCDNRPEPGANYPRPSQKRSVKSYPNLSFD